MECIDYSPSNVYITRVNLKKCKSLILKKCNLYLPKAIGMNWINILKNQLFKVINILKTVEFLYDEKAANCIYQI